MPDGHCTMSAYTMHVIALNGTKRDIIILGLLVKIAKNPNDNISAFECLPRDVIKIMITGCNPRLLCYCSS